MTERTQESVALTHACWLDRSLTIGAKEAAAELRRLHEVEQRRDELLQIVKRLVDNGLTTSLVKDARSAIDKNA